MDHRRLDRLTLIWTAIVVLTTALFFALIARPQFGKLRTVLSEIASERAERQAAGDLPARVAAADKDLQRLRAQTARMADVLPTEDRMAAFVEELARLARAHELRDEIEPGQNAIRSEGIVALPITFKLRGTFEGLHGFLAELEGMPRVSQIRRLETRADPDAPGTVTASLDLRIFYRVERPAQPSGERGNAGAWESGNGKRENVEM